MRKKQEAHDVPVGFLAGLAIIISKSALVQAVVKQKIFFLQLFAQ